MKLRRNINLDKLSLQRQAFIFSTISDLLRIGFSISQALAFIKTVSKRNREIVKKIEQKLEKGYALPDAMKFFLHNSIYQQLLIAEEHGKIENGLSDISEFIKVLLKQKNKIRDVVIYPLILFFILLLMLVSIKLFITPETNDLSNITATKNWTTYSLFLLILFLIVFCYYRIKQFFMQKAIYRANFLARLPFIGKLFSDYYEYYLTSNLAIMLSNGLNLRKIVQIFSQFKNKTLLFEIGREMDDLLCRGVKIETIFKRYHFASNELIVFLANGSTNEVLANNLYALSRLRFQQLISKLEKLISLIQPTAFVVIGIIIIVTYLQMLLPLYQSMESIY